MSGLSAFRAKNPQYNDVPDAKLLDALYKTHYSDIPRNKFNATMGADQPGIVDSLLNNPVMRGIHDAIISPALSLANQGARAIDSVTTLGGLSPSPLTSPLLQGAARGAETARTAIDSRFADASSRGQNTPGYAAARTNADAGAAQTGAGGFIDQMFAPVMPAATGTLAYLGQAGTNLANTISGKPVITTAADAANATADAASASLTDYQGQHPVLSATAALAPAALTLGQAAAPSLGRLITKVPKTNWQPAINAMRRFAKDQYRVMNQSGMVISQPSAQAAIADANNIDFNGANIIHPAMDSETYPGASRLRSKWQNMADAGPIKFQDAVNLRQNISDAETQAYGRRDNQDGMVLGALKDHMDDWVHNLQNGDMHIQNAPIPGQNIASLIAGVTPQVDTSAIVALSNARNAYHRMSTAADMNELLRRADIKSTANYAQAGQQQALIREFTNLALSRRFNRLSPDLQTAVLNVVQGKGSVDTVLRTVGKLAPRGALMPLLEGTSALSMFAAGRPVEGATILGGMAGAHLARVGSEARTLQYANDAVRLGLAGGKNINLPTIPSAAPRPLPALPSGLLGSGYLLARQPQSQAAQ